MGTTKTILAVLLCGVICGCVTTDPAHSSSASQPSTETFVHSHTKFSFPETIGEFKRVRIQKYDKKGKAVSVGYSNPSPVAMTVYVYPGPKDFAITPVPKSMSASENVLQQHFRTCKQEVVTGNQNVKLLGEAKCKVIQAGHEFEGRKAVFSMSYGFGGVPQPSISELYVFVMEPGVKFLLTDRQFVKYRATYPEAKRSQAEAEVGAFMHELVWPTK